MAHFCTAASRPTKEEYSRRQKTPWKKDQDKLEWLLKPFRLRHWHGIQQPKQSKGTITG